MEVECLSTIVITHKCYSWFFSWNPAGAIRAGRNPATYKSQGETVHVNGKLSTSITSQRKTIYVSKSTCFTINMYINHPLL